MKKHLFIVFTVVTAWGAGTHLFAADTNGMATDANTITVDTNGITIGTNSIPADGTNVTAELNEIIARVIARLDQGKSTEADLAGNLEEYDALYARHKGERSAAVIQIMLAKANLYTQVLNDPEKAIGTLRQIQHDFPGIQINGNTDDLIATLQDMAAVQKIQSSLVVGAPFPNFNEMDIDGKPLSVANYRGRVVLIDFWATWCPRCVIELPNIMAAYKKHQDQGFEVIGISLDDDRQQLEKFLRVNNGMTWPQYNDGLFWKTKLAVKYGIQKLPSNFLLDGSGNIIGKDLMGNELEAAVAKALANK
jgi:peroxiredoxin